MNNILSSTDFIAAAEADLAEVFHSIEQNEYHIQERVLEAFRVNLVAARHFNPTTGYGYDDDGRDVLDRLFASALQCEAALAVPQLSSGTHAIFMVLSALLRPNDTMLAITGRPYDTLINAIGIEGNAECSLGEMNVDYRQIELDNSGKIDIDALRAELTMHPRVVYLQRSRGYAWRNSLLPQDMASTFKTVKEISPNSIIVVDNCYGEFTQEAEPTAFGADLIVGSLIKNLGGGIAPTGGYVAGRKAYINRIANRITVPGIGREAGSYAAGYLPFYEGLFVAPHVVAQALKTAALFARMFEKLDLPTMPSSDSKRSDIVQALRFNTKDELIGFCKTIQSVSPIDSFVSPEPWAMPGYNDEVIMAAGTFVQGASIELSADAPIREPFTGYLQGGITYGHGRIAAGRVYEMLMGQTH